MTVEERYDDVAIYHASVEDLPQISKEQMKAWISLTLEENGGELTFDELFSKFDVDFDTSHHTLFTVALEEMVEEDGDVMAVNGYDEMIYLG